VQEVLHPRREGKRVRRWVNIEHSAVRKLAQLDWSTVLEDLKLPPRKGHGVPNKPDCAR